MSHDPTVTAAVITVVGTGTVAIVGSVVTLFTVRRSITSGERTARAALDSSEANVQATVLGEREHRLWERRTDLYVELLAYTTHQQQSRAHALRNYRLNQEAEDAITAQLGSYQPDSSWFTLEAKLRAYASEQVLRAFLDANTAHQRIQQAAREKEIATPGEASLAAFRAVDEALKAGVAKDEALIAVIRDEIHHMRTHRP